MGTTNYSFYKLGRRYIIQIIKIIFLFWAYLRLGISLNVYTYYTSMCLESY